MAALWWEYLQAEFGLIFTFWAITGDFSSFVDIGDSWNSTFTETASSFCLFMVLWFTFLFYDTSLNTDKCLKMKKWAGKGMQSQSWVGHGWGNCMPENSRLRHWLHVNSRSVKAPSTDGLPARWQYGLWCEERIEALGKEWLGLWAAEA